MLLSNLLVKHKVPQPRFAPSAFLALLAMFILLGTERPVFGLVGVGTTAVLAAALVLLNRKRIWENYRKTYRKGKGLAGFWAAPSPVYYNVNVWLLWPFVLFLGLVALWAAYALTEVSVY